MKTSLIIALLLSSLSGCMTTATDEPIDVAEGELSPRDKSLVNDQGRSLHDPKKGQKLAAAGLALADGKRSGGLCYAGVKEIFKKAGLPVGQTSLYDSKYGLSAYQFNKLAREQPGQLAKLGFAKTRFNPNNVPKGSVLVWGRGVCGYNKTHGHIEVAVGKGRACSDFCGRIRTGCGKPSLYVPVDRGGQ